MGTSDEAVRELLAQNPPAWVKGEFASEQPQHAVRLTGGYWLDKYEVTNAAFQAFVTAGGYTNQAYWSESGWQWLNGRATRDTCASQSAIAPATHPCVKVTWYEAEAYARWRGGRLPTEAEWEYAARGLQALSYPWGNTFDASQTNVVNSKGLTPVGSYPNGVSWVGAHDMAGNAMEWVQDWLAVNYYQASVSDNPTGPATGRQKVEKGGWWGSNPFVARSAYRHFEDPPDYSDEHIGFRIVSQ
jgi:formylglycine-generating enzyme required for sulfatase activity